MSAPDFRSAQAVAADIRFGKTTARGETLAALARARSDRFNAYTAVFAERALAQAEAIDADLAADRPVGPLAGVPFAVKNLFDVEGVTTIAGSKIRRDAPSAAHDATAVQRLTAAGAVLVGALNMDEFAYGFVTENAHDGPTRNPHDTTRIAGGSSGGSAAAVAGGLVPLTLGSDTNGSIRIPASLCGVFGLKPTLGRLSRQGAFPFVESLDHVGPFARSVADLALAYDLMQGPDPLDPLCGRPAEPAAPRLQAVADAPLRVGVLGGWFAQGAFPDVLEALEIVADALQARRGIELPGADAGARRRLLPDPGRGRPPAPARPEGPPPGLRPRRPRPPAGRRPGARGGRPGRRPLSSDIPRCRAQAVRGVRRAAGARLGLPRAGHRPGDHGNGRPAGFRAQEPGRLHPADQLYRPAGGGRAGQSAG
jgi:AtzE family amidohydrolase